MLQMMIHEWLEQKELLHRPKAVSVRILSTSPSYVIEMANLSVGYLRWCGDGWGQL